MNTSYKMKKQTGILMIFIIMVSCTNQFNEFDDFVDGQGNYIKNVYFPIQHPVRTLYLNEFSRLDNSMDLDNMFSVGVGIGGLYTNRISRTVTFEVAEDILADDFSINGNPMKVLPREYYSLSSESNIIIPAGDFNGTVVVSLNDAFFDDELSIGTNYVLPLRLLDSGDPEVGILSGVPADGISNPHPLIDSDWAVKPKDYTLFAIKYVNRFHGIYLHKGVDFTLDGPDGNVISDQTDRYEEQYLEQSLLTELATLSKDESLMNRVGRDNSNSMILTIDQNGSVTISSPEGSSLTISGTGEFVKPTDSRSLSWGDKAYQTLFLNYTYDDGEVYHKVNDTLVYRNDGLIFEEFILGVPN